MSISSSIIRTSPAQSTVDASAVAADHDEDLPYMSMHAKSRFFVGRVNLENGIATLITYDHQSVELPLSLLPDPLVVGEVVNMKVYRDPSAEDKRMQRIFQLQNDIAEYLRDKETLDQGDDAL